VAAQQAYAMAKGPAEMAAIAAACAEQGHFDMAAQVHQFLQSLVPENLRPWHLRSIERGDHSESATRLVRQFE